MPQKSSPKKKLSASEQRDLDAKIQFMEGLVRRDPDYVDALQLLGDHYTQRGRFNEGLTVDERLAQLEANSSFKENLLVSSSQRLRAPMARISTQKYRYSGNRVASASTVARPVQKRPVVRN